MFLTILIIHFFSSFHSKSITLHFDQYSIERPYPDITLDNICHFNTYINTYLSYSLLTVPSCLTPQPVSNTSLHLSNTMKLLHIHLPYLYQIIFSIIILYTFHTQKFILVIKA